MSDDRLRALERSAAAGSVEARLAWAAELERLGRRDDAFEALLPAIDHEAARVAIAERPAWTQVQGPGAAHHADVPPPRTAPPIAWSRSIGAAQVVAASELGIVLVDRHRVVVVDARTGEDRREHRRGPWTSVAIARDVVLFTRERAVVGYDLWRGTERFRAKLDARPCAFAVADRNLFVLMEDEVLAYVVGGEPVPVWRRSLDLYGHHQADDRWKTLSAAAGTLHVQCTDELVALDAATGATRWSRPGVWGRVRSDARGAVLHDRGLESRYDLVDVRGATIASESTASAGDDWDTIPDVVLAPDALLVLKERSLRQYPPRDEDEYFLWRVDRATGERAQLVDLESYVTPAVASCRDAVYLVHDRPWPAHVLARRGGETLWSIELPGGRHRLFPMWRKLLVEADGRLVCLAEPLRAPRHTARA